MEASEVNGPHWPLVVVVGVLVVVLLHWPSAIWGPFELREWHKLAGMAAAAAAAAATATAVAASTSKL